jgi:hypothetical protein
MERECTLCVEADTATSSESDESSLHTTTRFFEDSL